MGDGVSRGCDCERCRERRKTGSVASDGPAKGSHVTARDIVAGVCNAACNSDFRASDPVILAAFNRHFEFLEAARAAAVTERLKAEAALTTVQRELSEIRACLYRAVERHIPGHIGERLDAVVVEALDATMAERDFLRRQRDGLYLACRQRDEALATNRTLTELNEELAIRATQTERQIESARLAVERFMDEWAAIGPPPASREATA